MILPCGTFEYEAEFTKEGFSDSDIVVQGVDMSGWNEERLVGLNPMIRFWNDRIVIVAPRKHKSMLRNVSFSFGNAVSLSARPGDRLYLVRTGAGGIGLSVLRQQSLIVSVGAVTAVPLGRDVQIIKNPRSENPFEDPVLDTWLEVRVGSEQLILRNREVTEIGSHHIYIEHCWEDAVPGTDECVSVCVADSSAMKIAAMRSAILLANGNWKTTAWDCTEHLSAI